MSDSTDTSDEGQDGAGAGQVEVDITKLESGHSLIVSNFNGDLLMKYTYYRLIDGFVIGGLMGLWIGISFTLVVHQNFKLAFASAVLGLLASALYRAETITRRGDADA